GRWVEGRIGPVRIKSTYAFRTLLDTHAHLAFGSDWTVASLDPIWGIYAAVTRRTLDGKNPNGWVPEQKVSLGEALQAYTAGNAYAVFAERKWGVLAPGYFADVVILDHNLFTMPSASTGVRAPGAGLVLVPFSFCGACADVRPSLPASSRWPCCSKLTAKWWASRIMPIVREVFSTATTTMGGSKAACVTQFAVMPCSSPPCATVMT